ncbi:MAG: tetratricopeptide repeat protein [Pyrinomonadaceae bacterium]
MKRPFLNLAIALCLLSVALAPSVSAQRKTQGQRPASKPAAAAAKPKATNAAPKGDDALKAELEEIVKLAPAERVERLEEFVKSNQLSEPLSLLAQGFLTSARAALGDERLRAGDRAAGVELFRKAVEGAPEPMSNRLFVEVVSQLPGNLYVLGERDAALELARAVEPHAEGSAPRLLLLVSFYLGVERVADAARLAQEAVTAQPDLPAAHQALGTAYRYSLRLDDATAEFARAVELDPKEAGARRTLAELKRATGRPEEALALYREQLAADPRDSNAHAGVVLSLFDAGRREDAESELQSALTGLAGDLPLLVGASYWYSVHGQGARALELAERAVALEPRFGWAWARVAQGRALLALKRPLEAERALRAARKFGNFPTIDYETAAALAAAGLYDEAADTLSRSFALREGQIETRLAGRIETRAADFNELLAPERRASLAQFAGASGADEARVLKGLLALRQATGEGASDERAAADAARDFASGNDEMRTYRNVYAASRLERSGFAAGAALERAESAIGGVEAALDLPHAPVALFAETNEVRALRREVVEQDVPLNMVGVQRDVLSKVLRGRIEELAGWALFKQGQTAEAAVRLRRAVSVLPESTEWWRAAEWMLGQALEASGGGRDALAAYVNSYRSQPDPERRQVIETLYKKLNNGTLEGLDKLIGVAPPTTREQTQTQAAAPSPSTATQTADARGDSKLTTPMPAETQASPAPTPEVASVSAPAPTPSTTPETTPTPAITTPTPEATPTPTPDAAPSPTSEATPSPSPTPEAAMTPEATTTPEATPSPTPEATPTPDATHASERKTETRAGGTCALVVGDESVTIQANGGSATIALTLENYAGASPPRVNPSTSNWADIIILAEPRKPEDGERLRFTVSSVSNKTGAFVVTFASPCGKRDVTVNVR